MSRVTVIMSTWNAETFLDQCLESISNQTYPHFVVKLVDDCSTDRTLDIIESWCRKDSRFQLVAAHSENKGLTASLNELLRNVETEFVARMDADDVALQHRFEKQVDYLTRHKEISVVGSWAIDINEHGEEGALRLVPEAHEAIVKVILQANPMIHPSVMFRRKAIMKIGGYNEKYRFAQDYALWFHCLAHHLKLANIPEPLIGYRVIGNHVAKRSLKYRRIDASIRWHGARGIGRGYLASLCAASIPIMLGMVPHQLKKLAMKYRDYIDPRQKYKKTIAKGGVDR